CVRDSWGGGLDFW
nr:immunoglobulin heavy chain junction region [Macaca mulatta]